jgi:hypothetical protein
LRALEDLALNLDVLTARNAKPVVRTEAKAFLRPAGDPKKPRRRSRR